MHAYLLALEIEPVEVNRVYVALPLHCTVVHWFRSDKSPAEVLKAVKDIITDTPPLELMSGRADMFGLEKDVPVNRLVENDAILKLHRSLHTALQDVGAEDVAPMWSGAGFEPHVTRQRSGRFDEGRRFTARKVYLAEALIPEKLQQKKIIAKLFLKGSAAPTEH